MSSCSGAAQLLRPLDPAFTEDPTVLTGRLTDHAEALAAALEVGAADLDAIVGCAKVFPQDIEIILDLDNLSQLYRHVTLARTLTLRVQDYLRALELIDDAPFTDTTRTVLFAERVAEVRDSGFSFAELDYLLQHQSEASSGIALEDRVIVDCLKDLGRDLQKGAAKEAIARKLAETFGFEIRTVRLLESQWASLMQSTLADAGTELTKDNFPQQFADLVRLHKISVIAAHFNMKAGMLEWLLSHGDAQGLLDLTTLPAAPTTPAFRKWMRLVHLLALRPVFFRGEQGLLELLERAHHTPAGTRDELLNTLVEQTDWNGTDVEFLTGVTGFALTFPDDLENEKALLQLRDCFAVLKRLGMSAAQARTLSNGGCDGRGGSSGQAGGSGQSTMMPSGHVLPSRCATCCAKSSGPHWWTTLIASSRPPERGGDANGLLTRYHFLIDVEMAPCMMTSRIKQAISSVQLFVQRCLMNLEADSPGQFRNR